MNNEFIVELANILEINAAELNDASLLNNGDHWDSILLIATVALIDKHFNILLKGNQLNSIHTFGELKNLIEKETDAKCFLNGAGFDHLQAVS